MKSSVSISAGNTSPVLHGSLRVGGLGVMSAPFSPRPENRSAPQAHLVPWAAKRSPSQVTRELSQQGKENHVSSPRMPAMLSGSSNLKPRDTSMEVSRQQPAMLPGSLSLTPRNTSMEASVAQGSSLSKQKPAKLLGSLNLTPRNTSMEVPVAQGSGVSRPVSAVLPGSPNSKPRNLSTEVSVAQGLAFGRQNLTPRNTSMEVPVAQGSGVSRQVSTVLPGSPNSKPRNLSTEVSVAQGLAFGRQGVSRLASDGPLQVRKPGLIQSRKPASSQLSSAQYGIAAAPLTLPRQVAGIHSGAQLTSSVRSDGAPAQHKAAIATMTKIGTELTETPPSLKSEGGLTSPAGGDELVQMMKSLQAENEQLGLPKKASVSALTAELELRTRECTALRTELQEAVVWQQDVHEAVQKFQPAVVESEITKMRALECDALKTELREAAEWQKEVYEAVQKFQSAEGQLLQDGGARGLPPGVTEAEFLLVTNERTALRTELQEALELHREVNEALQKQVEESKKMRSQSPGSCNGCSTLKAELRESLVLHQQLNQAVNAYQSAVSPLKENEKSRTIPTGSNAEQQAAMESIRVEEKKIAFDRAKADLELGVTTVQKDAQTQFETYMQQSALQKQEANAGVDGADAAGDAWRRLGDLCRELCCAKPSQLLTALKAAARPEDKLVRSSHNAAGVAEDACHVPVTAG